MSEISETKIEKNYENSNKNSKTKDSSFSSDKSNLSFEKTEENEKRKINFPNIKNNKIIKSISNLLIKLTERPLKNIKRKSLKDIFTGKRLPNISMSDYLIRIITYSEIEENTLISSLIYLDRFDQKKQITKFNIHRILFCSILISIKYNEDEIYKNEFYSQIAGISLEELNKIEYEFVSLLDFNLYIQPNMFNFYKELLVNNID